MKLVAANRLRGLTNIFKFSDKKRFQYKFLYGSKMIPHPEKAHKGG